MSGYNPAGKVGTLTSTRLFWGCFFRITGTVFAAFCLLIAGCFLVAWLRDTHPRLLALLLLTGFSSLIGFLVAYICYGLPGTYHNGIEQ
jgi:hypothetical protein